MTAHPPTEATRPAPEPLLRTRAELPHTARPCRGLADPPASRVPQLRAALNGRRITPDDPAYDQARLWVDLRWIRLATVAAFVSAFWESGGTSPEPGTKRSNRWNEQ